MQVNHSYPDISNVLVYDQFTAGTPFLFQGADITFEISVTADTISVSQFQYHHVPPGWTVGFSGPPGSPNGAADPGVTFNGLVLHDLNQAFGPVSIVSVTGLPGFDLSRVSVNDTELGLNFMGLNYTGGQSEVVLHVDSLPDGGSTAGLLAVALVGIAVVRRKQQA